MNTASLTTLQYDRIRDEVERFAVSYLGKRHIRDMMPLTTLKAARQRLDETAEAAELLRTGASVPIPSLDGIETVLQLLGTGYVLNEQDFTHVLQFLRSCRQLIRYMVSKQAVAPTVSSYAASMYELASLLSAIEQSIYAGRVVDSASKELAKVRKKILTAEDRIKRKLDALLSRHRDILQESLVSKRNGRYVLPIKKEHRRLVQGSVLDESASGQTVYIEPAEVSQLQLELSFLQTEEAREELKVLSELTAQAEKYHHEMQLNADTVGMYDYLIARAKFSLSIGGRNVRLNDEGVVVLHQAVHPLLGGKMIPLDFAIGQDYTALVITGPNTGGKTLTLKTVGLLTLMAQSGLLIPAAPDSECCVYRQVSVDIGDGQSIEHALSTFSAHIRNVNEILRTANEQTLILLDEMASGTDPGEGVGLSIAVLEELHRCRSTIVVTTHFTEIKRFAGSTPGFQNARMEFDTVTLEPKYKLVIGEAGRSYAFVIAEKLGISSAIIDRARQIAESGTDTMEFGLESGKSVGILKPLPGPLPEQQQHPESQPLHKEQPAPDQREHSLPPKPEQTVHNNGDGDSSSHPSHRHRGDAQPARPAQSRHGVPPVPSQTDSSPRAFQLGDAVYVPYLNRTGIVCETRDNRGLVGVMIQKQKFKINHKRIRLYIENTELYPDNYDLDIVLESKDTRKKRKLMARKHVDGLSIEKKPED